MPNRHHCSFFPSTSNRSRLPKYRYRVYRTLAVSVPYCLTMLTTVTAHREIALLQGVGWDRNRRSCDDAINPGSLMSPPPPRHSLAGIPPPASLAARSSTSAHDVTSSGSDRWAAELICNLPVSFYVFQLSEKLRTSSNYLVMALRMYGLLIYFCFRAVRKREREGGNRERA